MLCQAEITADFLMMRKDANIPQVAIVFGVVETVSHHEDVGDMESDVSGPEAIAWVRSARRAGYRRAAWSKMPRLL